MFASVDLDNSGTIGPQEFAALLGPDLAAKRTLMQEQNAQTSPQIPGTDDDGLGPWNNKNVTDENIDSVV
eukprot:SAG31_NODE_16615_length_702_cov_1.457711_1_plen_69_part_10